MTLELIQHSIHETDDMPEQDRNVAVLETKISSMSEDISHIRAAVDALGKSLSKFAVFEEKQKGQSEALDRAFTEIDKLNDEVDRLDRARQDERDRVNKWIYGITGAVFAFSLAWGVAGMYVTDSVRQIIKTNEEMRVYLMAQQYQNSGHLPPPSGSMKQRGE